MRVSQAKTTVELLNIYFFSVYGKFSDVSEIKMKHYTTILKTLVTNCFLHLSRSKVHLIIILVSKFQTPFKEQFLPPK